MSEKPERSVHFAPGAIADAQKRKGLEDKTIVRELGGLSVRTWQRWKNTDTIPRTRCLAVVLLLGLPQPDGCDDEDRTPWVILEALEDVLTALREIRREVSAPRGSAEAPP